MKKITNWIAHHNPKWLALIRVALGATLLFRGKNYLDHIDILRDDFDKIVSASSTDFLTHTIPWVHICGGFLIIIGILTRFASILQVPIVLAAIFFVGILDFFSAKGDLLVSIGILLFLVIFIIEGSGKLSLAHYIKEADGSATDDEEE